MKKSWIFERHLSKLSDNIILLSLFIPLASSKLHPTVARYQL